jgi:molecular chaperone GrpE (heat shock protein)
MTPEQQSIHLVGRLAKLERELEQERQDRKQAELDVCRALGERNDARAEVEQIKTILTDPLAVHLNMMRGTIAWSPANLRHLLGDTSDARAELASVRLQLKAD